MISFVFLMLVFYSPEQGALDARPLRTVYIFGNSTHHTTVIAQLDSLNRYRSECAERDMRILLVDQLKERESLHFRFGLTPSTFAVVLVGKDGTEKFRSTQPVSAPALFALIDQMPMRRWEMRQRAFK
jgi:hypothetical protein